MHEDIFEYLSEPIFLQMKVKLMSNSDAGLSNSPENKPKIEVRVFWAVGAALIYAVILYILIWGDNSGAYLKVIAGLTLLPMAVASVIVIIADPRGEGEVGRQLGITAVTISLFIIIALMFFGEGFICVVMAAPFVYGGAVLGTLLTSLVLRNLRARGVIAILPILALPIEPHISYPNRHSEVTTVIDIAAPPEIVWRQTVEVRNIRPEELSWTFSHGVLGVPRPEDARMDGEGVGAVRHLRWGSGVKFQEIVTSWDENRHLAWNFRFGPDSIPPAIEAHIKVDSKYLHIQSGDYRLEPAADGKTRLTLTTHYRMATPINSYCDWWGRIFLSDFHDIVLDVIRKRSEAEALRRAEPESVQSRLDR